MFCVGLPACVPPATMRVQARDHRGLEEPRGLHGHVSKETSSSSDPADSMNLQMFPGPVAERTTKLPLSYASAAS